MVKKIICIGIAVILLFSIMACSVPSVNNESELQLLYTQAVELGFEGSYEEFVYNILAKIDGLEDENKQLTERIAIMEKEIRKLNFINEHGKTDWSGYVHGTHEENRKTDSSDKLPEYYEIVDNMPDYVYVSDDDAFKILSIEYPEEVKITGDEEKENYFNVKVSVLNISGNDLLRYDKWRPSIKIFTEHNGKVDYLIDRTIIFTVADYVDVIKKDATVIGWFTFSTEIKDNQNDYILAPEGRYNIKVGNGQVIENAITFIR